MPKTIQVPQPERELTQWINGFEGRVALVASGGVSQAWSERLVNAGVPAERIFVSTPDAFKPSEDFLMVVSDDARLLRMTKEAGSEVARVLIVGRDQFKAGSRDLRSSGFTVIHDGMDSGRMENILLEGLLPVLDARQGLAPGEASARTEDPLIAEEKALTAKAKALVGGRKVMVCSTYAPSNEREFVSVIYPGVLEPEQVVLERNPDAALQNILSKPGDYAMVVSSKPEVLSAVRDNPKTAGLVRIYHTHQRYLEGDWERERDGLGAHHSLRAHDMSAREFAQFVVDAFNQKSKA